MEITWSRISFEVEEWFHQDHMKTLGFVQSEHAPNYAIGISPYNTLEGDFYYASIIVEKLTELSNKIYTFKGRTKSIYKFNIPKDKTPLATLIFLFVERAAYDFALEYTQRVAGTTLQFHKIPVPILADMESNIQNMIDHWDLNIRYTQLN